jgi:hypothetical protein
MPLPTPLTTEADVHAFRALMAGTADSGHQALVVAWLGRATGRADIPYVPGPDGERDTLVLIGQQRIGVMIGNMASPEFLASVRAEDEARKARAANTRQR